MVWKSHFVKWRMIQRPKSVSTLCLQRKLTGSLDQSRTNCSHCAWCVLTLLVQILALGIQKFCAQCAKLFPIGRVFSTNTQLWQVACEFLDCWGLCCTRQANCLSLCKSSNMPKTCPKKQMTKSHVHKDQQVNCLFEICHSLLNKKKAVNKPKSFHLAKVTSMCLEHKCQLSTVFHHEALEKSDCATLNLTNMKCLLLALPLWSPRCVCKEPVATSKRSHSLVPWLQFQDHG